MGSSPPTELGEEWRRLMPVARRWAYFDHAAVAPISAPVRDAMVQWAEDAAENGGASWAGWRKKIEAARRSAATLLNADVGEIAFVNNTTDGVGRVAEGFPWMSGDNVVVPDSEFPSNRFPWLALQSRGVETRLVAAKNERLDPASIAAACDRRTRIVSVSWVGYATGWRNDLDVIAEIAHRCGAKLFVDAIQALGVFPLDVQRTPVDFLAADGHKWLLAPEGAGVLYIRNSELETLKTLSPGWNSVRQTGDFSDAPMDLKPSAARHEGGSLHSAGVIALGVAIDLLLKSGIATLSQRLLDVTDELADRLESEGARVASERGELWGSDRRSGIIAFDWPGIDPIQARRHCLARNVALNARQGRLRVSPHVYHHPDDTDRLIEALRTAPR